MTSGTLNSRGHLVCRSFAVVDPGDGDRDAIGSRSRWQACFAGSGVSINSNGYNGLTTADFKRRITNDLAKSGLGREAVNYKLRDWLFSRQRFWGEPFPILHELDDKGEPTGMIRAVDEKDLPVDLPHLDDYRPWQAAWRDGPEPPLWPQPPLPPPRIGSSR